MTFAQKEIKKDFAFNLQPAVIQISNLRLRTYIGFNDEEKQKKQDVVINGTIRYDALLASHSDLKNDALNYRTITKKIIEHVEENSFHLLEKLSHDLLLIALENPEVLEASFTVDKPNALRFADSVSVTQTATRI